MLDCLHRYARSGQYRGESRAAGIARAAVAAGIVLTLLVVGHVSASASGRPHRLGAFSSANGDVTGTVTDSTTQRPIPDVDLIVRQAGQVVARTSSDAFGRFTVHDLPTGSYELEARAVGFHPVRQTVVIAEGRVPVALTFRMQPAPVELQAVEVEAPIPVAIDTRSGDQVFKQNEYHGAPTNTTSQILQQSIVGAARAPTGEVHIRGQHAEYTYYVDGVPVPAGVSGSLNELFDPAVVNRIDFITGGWDAEYGNKNAAVVNVSTRIPAGGAHVDASSYVGSFKTNGQTLSASTNAAKWGFFASGSRQVTDMRREPVIFDPAGRSVINLHNHGEDLFGFGKIQFLPSDKDIVNLDLNWSRTRFAVPFDTTGGVNQDDHQQDINSFQNLGWRHRFGGNSGPGSELFAAVFHRNGSLKYTPGENDDPQFVFFPDTLTPFNLREDRSFNTTGIKLDLTTRLSEHAEFKFGTLSSLTRGHEDFVTTDANGSAGPASNSDLRGHDIGVYAQTSLAPSEKVEIRAGVRWDEHEAPFAGKLHQVSPRIRLSFFPDPANTLWLYYGRLFLPTNVEDLRAITSVAQGGVAADPTLPERDHFFEVGYVHRFPVGVVAKLSAYHKFSSPGIDDNTVPGSAITTSVNIDKVYINGIEAVLEVRPGGPITGYANIGLNHAYGHGPITGGFFPSDNPSGYFDLDHDQRLSIVGNLNYAPQRLFLSATGIYGSGLTNGADPDATYDTGLFSFNRSIKVNPNFILNLSGGYSFAVGKVALRPQVYLDNALNKKYALKGAFFSGPSIGRPRSVQVRLNLGL